MANKHKEGNSRQSSERQMNPWQKIVEAILGNDHPELMKNGTDGKEKYNKKKLAKEIRKRTKNLVNFVELIQGTDVYNDIINEQSILQTEWGFDKDEANKAAWQNRYYLVKKKIIDPILKERGQQKDVGPGDDDRVLLRHRPNARPRLRRLHNHHQLPKERQNNEQVPSEE